MPVRGLQGDPRVHWGLHLPLDEEQGEQPAAQPGALPQADRGLGLILDSSHLALTIVDQLDQLCHFGHLDQLTKGCA